MSKKTRTSTKSPNAIEFLIKDHKKVRALLKALEKANETSGRRDILFKKIERELKIHTQIEEKIFYPAYQEAVKKKADRKLYFEAKVEHHVVDLVLPEIAKTDSTTELFAAKAKVLKDLVEHHADEEETEMFPVARKVISKEELKELGIKLQAHKTELEKKIK